MNAGPTLQDSQSLATRAIFDACYQPNYDIEYRKDEITYRLDEGFITVDVRFEDTTLLHVAVGREDLELVKFLLLLGLRPMPDGQGRFPSVLAAELGLNVDSELFEVLVESEKDAWQLGVDYHETYGRR